MKTILVWVILSATACAGKCAVNFQSASFVRGQPQIREAFQARWPASFTIFLFVKIFTGHTDRSAEIGKRHQWTSADWAAGGWFQQSRHAAIVLSPGTGFFESARPANRGSSKKDLR
jgi:hypothetical protein